MSDADNGTSVLRLFAGDTERDGEGRFIEPEPIGLRRGKCNDRGILLDEHVWDAARKACVRCKAAR